MVVEVYAGNTGDPTAVPDQVDKLRERFGLSRVVLAGDRGMLTQTQIEHLKEHPGLGWISCLHTYRIVSDPSGGTFDQLTEMSPFQAEAFRLIDL